MSSLSVVALFINGIQAILPAPAFVEGATSWVPARAVLERLGCEVLWAGPKSALLAHAPGGRMFVFVAKSGPQGHASLAATSSFMYKNEQTIIYISASDCAAVVGGAATWSRELRRVFITSPALLASAPSPLSVSDVAAVGPEGFGKTYLVNGAYGGWHEPTPSSAVMRRQATPEAPQAWVLSDGRASVQCANAQNAGEPLRFSPFGERGTPLQVLATAEPADDCPGLALRVYDVTKRRGEGGGTCRLEVARTRHNDALLICATVWGAPDADAIARGLKVTASTDSGARIPITNTIYTQKTSNTDTESCAVICFRWITTDVSHGEYRITASLGGNVTSNEVAVTVGSR
jgi:hypothetical protein